MFKLTEGGFVANSGGNGLAGARNDKGAGDKLVAFLLSDIVLLTGDKRFVNLDGSLSDLAVDEDLIAERIDDEVAFDDLVLRNLTRFAIPDDGRFLLGNETHFINGFLRPDFVDDADQSVKNGDKNEEEVLVGTDHENHDGEDEVDEVEDSEGVS